LPLGGRGLEASYLAFVERRLQSSRTASPAEVVLHGSRAEGTATTQSDFDLLVLFPGGSSCDFFVGEEAGGPRVEVEFAESGKFHQIATRPVFFAALGAVELSKLAKGVVLWGDAEAWEAWALGLLRTALKLGRVYWLLLALGMALRPDKAGVSMELFVGALRALMRRVDADAYREDLARLDPAHPGGLGPLVLAALDRELPSWREDASSGRRVFAHQVPEVWLALRWAMEGP
jgi:predicted nucleotidyltransferase